MPFVVAFPGNLDLFLAGVGTFEPPGQNDGGSANTDRLFRLFVDPADAVVAVKPAGGLAQVLWRSLYRHGQGCFQVGQVYRLRGFEQFVQRVVRCVLAQLDV